MAKSARKNVPEVGMEPGAACIMPAGLASDRATAPGQMGERNELITDNRMIREKGNYHSVASAKDICLIINKERKK